MGASLKEFNDRDLLHRLAGEGSMTSGELAEAIGLKGETAAQAVGIRSSWMRHFGYFTFDRETKLWTLSAAGERIVEAHVRAPLVRELDALPAEQMVDVMAHVTAKYQAADAVTATFLEREFAHNRYLRHNRNGRPR